VASLAADAVRELERPRRPGLVDLNLPWLRSWVEVVDSGGFARAATRLHLSQPRVSAHVASLERGLGCALIDRRARPLALTDQGKRLLPRARSILAAVDDTVSDMKSTATTCAGKLAIASFASASSAFLPDVLMKLRTANPLLEVAVLDGDVSSIELALTERQVAVALRPFRPDPADPALVRQGIWREPFVVLAPAGHPILGNETVRLGQIARFPVITLGDPLLDPILGYEALFAMHSSGITAPVGFVSHQPSTLAAMVRAGHGIGLVNLLAATMVRNDGLEMRRVDSRHLRRDVALWWHSERPLSRAAQAFIDLALSSERPEGTLPLAPDWN
jgi:DNA-binding transcriptional LysR family regulator